MKVNIKPAATGNYHHRYDLMSIASLDFGQLVPIKVQECVASDQWNNFHGEGTLRLAPQVFPAYGKAYLKIAAFFVPEYQIMEGSEALRNNMNSYKGKAIDFVHCVHHQIIELFTSHLTGVYAWASVVSHSTSTTSFPTQSTYDFYDVVNVSGTSDYYFYKLTSIGREIYKMLKGCGIDFPSATGTGTYAQDYATTTNPISLTCLLSFAKIYVDMYLNSHRYNDDPLVTLLHHIHDNDTYVVSGNTYFDSSTGILSTDAISLILESIKVPHMQNMYTTAWNSPNSPLGVNPGNSMNSINPNGALSPYVDSGTSIAGRIYTDNNDTSLVTSNTSSITYLSSFGERVKSRFVDFLRRNNLFGNKAVQRTLVRLGLKSDDYNSHYVRKLYESSFRIDFSAVMSNSDTAGKSLASYAGFGISHPVIDFNYHCNENGFIFVLAWIQQAPIWFRGTSPFNLRRYSFDYWTPEYDGEACRAIPYMEFTSSKTPTRTGCSDASVYGYTDLYDEYRYDQDTVLGDFLLDETTTQQFFFGRNLSGERDVRTTLTFKPQSNFVQYYNGTGIGYDLDLNNPFQWQKTLADRFYLSLDWNIDAVRPIKSKSDALMLNGSGDLDTALGGHLID